jgi:surfactin synthase thioesterase subunit
LINDKLFLIPKPISDPSVRLFCFPYAGGTANTFIPWVEPLAAQDVELVLIQPPGRGSRFGEPPHTNMDSLIKELMKNEAFITSHIPYVFFGHSLGSRVAYELCSRLMNRGLPLPEYFIASGSRAPHSPNENDSLHDLPQKEFIQQLKQLNGTPKELLENQDLMDLVTPLLRADFKISETYQAKKICMPFPILVFSGVDDHEITPCHLELWSDLSTQGCELVQFPGDHFFIDQYSEQVLTQLSSVLNRSLASIARC